MDKFTPRTAFIAIIGCPNVGKSTLLNRFLGEKVAAVSKKPQTTRTRITGILTKENTQYVFLDTPGMHKPKTKLGDSMIKAISTAVGDVDAVLFVTEAKGEMTSIEEQMLTKLQKQGYPIILLINKSDIAKKGDILTTIDIFTKKFTFASVIPISAETGDSVDIIFDELEPFVAEGDWMFPSDMITDQPERVIAAEVIREKMLRLLDDEVPHGTAVVIEDFKDIRGHLIDIRAEIYCEKDGHKGIIIGKNGAMMKKIGTYAREDLEAFFGTKVNLNLWLKVKENWRDSVASITNFGLNSEE
ncbi:MAG: GTPase Era [Ruminococcaceae bacterium]|nr:GTPase Era [Oscillospiraceae bacterium]